MRQHGAALMREGVSRTHGSANLRHEHAALSGELQNFAQRNFQVLLNVVTQCLEWRHVENFGLIHQLPAESLAHEAINADEESRQCFP